MEKLELTKNLSLIQIEENHYEGSNLKAVACWFEFFNEEGVAYITIDALEKEHPCYAMTEIASELSNSFNELLNENWLKILKPVKAFVKEWQTKHSN